MNPTQLQLAAIAATMATQAENPNNTARRALQLWQACGAELERTAPALAKREQAVSAAAVSREETRQWLSQFTPGEPVPLDVFLRAVMPRSKPEDLAKWWRDYTAHFNSDKEVDRLMKRDREQGIAPDELVPCRESFLCFIAMGRAEKNRAKGRKGVAAKKIRASAK